MSGTKTDLSSKDVRKQIYAQCLASPEFFIMNFVYIQMSEGGRGKFDLFVFQKKLLHLLKTRDRLIILKSRQLGITTLSAAYALWLMIFKNDQSILALAPDQDKARQILDKIAFSYDNLPAWLLKMANAEAVEKNKLRITLNNGSKAVAASGASKSARGKTATFLVLDEAAFIENAEELWGSAHQTMACLKEDSLVLTNKGLVRIGDYDKDNLEYGFHDQNNLIVNIEGEEEVSNSFYKSPESQLYKVKFKSGNEIVTTKDHPLYTNLGWTTCENLIAGLHSVKTLYNTNKFGDTINYSEVNKDFHHNTKIRSIDNIDFAYLAGLWTAEGHFDNSSVCITNTDPEITSWLQRIGFTNIDERHWVCPSVQYKKLLKFLGCSGVAKTKKIPSKILSASKEEQAAFLSGLFDGDGCAEGRGGYISYTSSSNRLIQDLYSMLLNFGIKSNIKYVEQKSPKSTCVNPEHTFKGWVLHIEGYDCTTFYKKIGFRLSRKQVRFNTLSKRPIKKIKLDKETIKNLVFKSGFTIKGFNKVGGCLDRFLWHNKNSHLSISTVKDLLTLCDKTLSEHKYLEKELNTQTSEFYDEVVSVTEDVFSVSYDFKVPNTNSFIANGLVNHNTGGSAIVLSTPFGASGWFFDMWESAESGDNEFIPVKLQWTVHPNRDQVWRDRQDEELGKRMAAQECDALFTSSGDTYFEAEDLQKFSENVLDPLEMRGPLADYWIWKHKDYCGNCMAIVDTSRGDGADFSTIVVIELDTMEQVAEYKGLLEPIHLAEKSVEIALEYNSALLIIENTGVGFSTCSHAKQSGYINIYYAPKDDSEETMMNIGYVDENKMTIGFTTSTKTRDKVLSALREAMLDGSLKVRSRRAHSEFKTFIWKRGKPQAQSGRNDDLLMSLAIGCYLRNTAIRFKTQGLEMQRAVLGGIVKTNYNTVYKTSNTSTNPYLWTNPYSGETEDISWLAR